MANGPASNNEESLQSTVTVQSPDGAQVDVTVTLSYPTGKGLYALRAITGAGIDEEPLWEELLSRQDSSAIKYLADNPDPSASGHP